MLRRRMLPVNPHILRRYRKRLRRQASRKIPCTTILLLLNYIGVKMLLAFKNSLSPTLKRRVKLFMLTFRQSSIHFLTRHPIKFYNILHLVFVCQGNICRSAFAEYYCIPLALSAELKIESCGLNVGRSVPSPPDALIVAGEFGVNLSENRSKGLASCDLERADLVVAMEYDHLKELIQKFPHKKKQIVLLRDFAPWPESLACNIHDPYGWGLEEFRVCFRAMQRALDGLARQLKQGHRG